LDTVETLITQEFPEERSDRFADESMKKLHRNACPCLRKKGRRLDKQEPWYLVRAAGTLSIPVLL
jgi:hypothetical protein